VNLKAAGRVRSGEMKRKDRRWKATERAWKNDEDGVGTDKQRGKEDESE
jgi:hypothetical protein